MYKLSTSYACFEDASFTMCIKEKAIKLVITKRVWRMNIQWRTCSFGFGKIFNSFSHSSSSSNCFLGFMFFNYFLTILIRLT